MGTNRDIHAFALKWLPLWEDRNTPEYVLDDSRFADDCFALGFKMDGGHAFEVAYSHKAFHDAACFRSIVNQIDDVSVLGSGLVSHWRSITHWSNEDLSSEEQRTWFIAALTRLAELTSAPG